MDELDLKITTEFPGKCVRKDLTSTLRRGANVPTFVLEYLLGMYCATDDQAAIDAGMEKIRRILHDNYVRPEESERIKSLIREKGEYTIIDKITARFDEYLDIYAASFSNFGIDPFEIQEKFVIDNPKILTGGIWCLTKIAYIGGNDIDGKTRRKGDPRESPFRLVSFRPIQLPNLDIDEFISKRKNFTTEEWVDMLIRSEGLEPNALQSNEKMHYLMRMVPLIERNYNLCELGPRGTGKSHLYKEITPYAILVSGGQSTSANLFYNISRRQMGLVGHWDCVAFDEIAGMHFKDHDAIQIMKDYMASGSFARGQDSKSADSSMVFVGNINENIQNILKTSHLFHPFPDEFNNDSAFFDRMHYYLPGWEIPVMKSKILTDRFGLITDCLAEFTRGMRKYDFTHIVDEYFQLNKKFSKRDETAVRKTVSGFIKLVFPDQNITKEEMKTILEYAIEGRRRVKEQLKIIAGNEFADVDLGYIDEENKTHVVGVPEKNTSYLIPANKLPSGHVFAAGNSINDGSAAVYRIEIMVTKGNGKINPQGTGSNRQINESINAAWMYFKSSAKEVSPSIKTNAMDCFLNYEGPRPNDASMDSSLAEFVGLCSAALDRPIMESTVFVGDLKITGSIGETANLPDVIKAAKAAGAKKIFLPFSSMGELMQAPKSLLMSITPIYYIDPIDAANKALDLN